MPMDSKDKRQKIGKNKTFQASFEFAWHGFITAYFEEKNMRVHVFMAGVSIFLGLIFRLSLNEWRWLILMIFLVIVMEIINTAFENLVDLVTDRHFHELAKKVKDMAAAAVLWTALFAVFIGGTIFIPKIWNLVKNLF